MATTPSSRKCDIFPFLDLPGELRNKVYEEALHHDRANDRLAAVALLGVCQQINSEAKDLLFEESTFSIRVRNSKPWVSGTRVLALESTGDFVAKLHGKRQPLSRFASPSMGCIYDVLPQVALKLRRINIDIQPYCCDTTSNFMYALACLLNTAGSKTQELHIRVVGGADALYDSKSAESMWYSLMKMPENLSIYMSGALGRNVSHQHLAIETHVHRRLLRDNKPHPCRPSNSTFNLITKSRHIIAFARPIMRSTHNARALVQGSSDDYDALCYEFDKKLRSIEQMVERGAPYHENMNPYLEQEWRVDLECCEEWARRITSAKNLGYEEEEAMLRTYYKKQHMAFEETEGWDLYSGRDANRFPVTDLTAEDE